MTGYEKDEKATQTGARVLERPRGVAPINTPIECEVCGSEWFYSVHAEQFSGGGYGSVEMRSITGNPVQMRICLCGNPIVPQAQNFGGSRALGTRESFYIAAKKAKANRKAVTLDHVAEIAASPSEIKDLQRQLDDLALQAAEIKSLVSQIAEIKLQVAEMNKAKKPKKGSDPGP